MINTNKDFDNIIKIIKKICKVKNKKKFNSKKNAFNSKK